MLCAARWRHNRSTVVGFGFFYTPWIAIPTAHVRTEAAINMTSGLFTVDFSDFAIAIPRGQTKRAAFFP
jgi:hypothetical protein